jgi:hypothetical protein
VLNSTIAAKIQGSADWAEKKKVKESSMKKKNNGQL